MVTFKRVESYRWHLDTILKPGTIFITCIHRIHDKMNSWHLDRNPCLIIVIVQHCIRRCIYIGLYKIVLISVCCLILHAIIVTIGLWSLLRSRAIAVRWSPAPIGFLSGRAWKGLPAPSGGSCMDFLKHVFFHQNAGLCRWYLVSALHVGGIRSPLHIKLACDHRRERHAQSIAQWIIPLTIYYHNSPLTIIGLSSMCINWRWFITKMVYDITHKCLCLNEAIIIAYIHSHSKSRFI